MSEVSLKKQTLRLNKFISHTSLCSRRHADILIKNGHISVNGTITRTLSTIVTNSDVVTYKNKPLRLIKNPKYILLNKPLNCLTTLYDPQHRRTVLDYVKTKERLYPVGRLDRNTSGVLLLTNDGKMTTLLTHPSSNIKKIYKASLDTALTKTDEQLLKKTIPLEDGPFAFDDVKILDDKRTELTLTLHSGRNRIIRRVFDKLNYRLLALERISYAGITTRNLPRGTSRPLTQTEINNLKNLIKTKNDMFPTVFICFTLKKNKFSHQQKPRTSSGSFSNILI